ncbi:MAG: hypothetical protein ACQESG_03590, partial [Nanobdellota archaeon]
PQQDPFGNNPQQDPFGNSPQQNTFGSAQSSQDLFGNSPQQESRGNQYAAGSQSSQGGAFGPQSPQRQDSQQGFTNPRARFATGSRVRPEDYRQEEAHDGGKDEIIINKLDTIRAMIDNINQRLSLLEDSVRKRW